MPRRSPDPAPDLGRELLARHILVVCGSGGVGKTTTAAALALRAALFGRRVLVCTIDPSRRLATSLGLAQLSGRPRALDLRRFSPAKGGALSAMVLDTQSTFDALVTRYAPDAAARERILKNRFYREISAALAGSHEYMAMEKLLDLSADERFELVVLDTPPTRHALDFLEAPDRLMTFLDASILRFFLKPYFFAGRLTIKVATRTGALALKLVDRFLGLDFLRDLSEFFLAFESMYDGFKERAARVHDLLRDEGSAFLLVASPAPAVLGEALYFHGRLAEKGMPLVGVVVNRVHADPAARPARGERPRPARVGPELQARLLRLVRDQQALHRAEARSIARLEVDTGERPLLVPEFEADVHDLRDLRAVGDALFGLPAEAPRSRRVSS
jgi:anion-transporting  ArsA/GET3 family ATPase